MALLTNPALAVDKLKGTTSEENLTTAATNLAAPKKISNRPVEPVPAFDWNAAGQSVSNAQAMAKTGSVSGDSLVQTQLDKVLAADGPLLKRARTDGLNSSAEKGLNNASIGVQAGEEAMIRQALPIAQQDASTNANMDLANLNAQNQFGMSGLNQEFTAFNQKNQNNFTAGENELDRTQKEDLFTRGNDFTKSMQDSQNLFTATNAKESDDRRIQADKDIQAANAKSSLDLYDVKRADDVADKKNDQGLGIVSNYQESVKQIMAQPGITPSQAEASIKMLTETTRNSMEVYKAISGVDLTEFLPKGTMTGTSTTDKKGVVTNTFSYQNSQPTQAVAAPTTTTGPQTNDAYMNEIITVNVNMGGRMMAQRMPRRQAIAAGLAKA